MKYALYPQIKQIEYREGACPPRLLEGTARCLGGEGLIGVLPPGLRPQRCETGRGFLYEAGCPEDPGRVTEAQGYALSVSPGGVALRAADREGLRYGLDTLGQIIAQSKGRPLGCLRIADWPSLINRGLMLDLSRGKVYTRDHLLELADLLGRLRYNVLQLYTEHTFDFQKHPEICRGSGPMTAGDLKALQERCEANGIELQACLQSLGHCRRILTRPEYRELAESDMFWSLSTTSEGSFRLIGDLYSEYLPLFHSPWLNACLDEPYDIGHSRSAGRDMGRGGLYLYYVLRIHQIAAGYGKRIMLFGDFFQRHPELVDLMPDDIVYLDWVYDPKERYGTPAVYRRNGRPFWVCPGTGNWNTLFPRLDGAVTNVVNLTLEGIGEGAEGMLLTDWNDHGAYAQPGPGYYLYAYAADVAWGGEDPGREAAGAWADRALGLPGYAAVILKMAGIYRIPPIWSANRCECVMALFDEPIFGGAVRGPAPPEGLKAYDMSLPAGVKPVFERHSRHPQRPYFSIPASACQEIRKIACEARPMAEKLAEGVVRDQLLYLLDAFDLMLDKLDLSRRIIARFGAGAPSVGELIGFEDELRILIGRYVRLRMAYERCWLTVSGHAEIEISLSYFAHIVERLDYLRDWLSLQRENDARRLRIDTDFSSYVTAGYDTLPTMEADGWSW